MKQAQTVNAAPFIRRFGLQDVMCNLGGKHNNIAKNWTKEIDKRNKTGIIKRVYYEINQYLQELELPDIF